MTLTLMLMMVLVSMVVFLLATLGLSLGVVLGRRPLTGSCGAAECGPGDAGQSSCDACPRRRPHAPHVEIRP